MYVSYECELALNQYTLVLRMPSLAHMQPHILSQVCDVYASYKYEAGLELVHRSVGVEKAFISPTSRSKSIKFVLCTVAI